jgi:hypothetical protein
LKSLLEPQLSGLLRVLVLSPQRSPAVLMAAARAGLPQKPEPVSKKKPKAQEEENPFLKVLPPSVTAAASAAPPPVLSVDIAAVVGSLDGVLLPSDFFPVSVLSAVAPLLRLLGVGNFSMRPHPLCGMVAFLVPIGGALVPVSRFVDVSAFFAGIVPLLPVLNASTDLGWNVARKLRTVFQESLLPGAEGQMPDLVSFLASPEKAQDAQQLLERAVLVLVHNNMDLMSLDLVRRCECASVSSTPLTQNNLSAQCLGCI